MVLGHAHANPALDGWYQGLKSPSGGSCCDGSDAASVLDPDWDTTGDPAYPYRVRLEGEWIRVPEGRVVHEANKAGVAKVWPIYENGKPAVRCFLKGSES